MCNTTRIPPLSESTRTELSFPKSLLWAAVEWVTLNGCSFPLFVIPGLTRNPVFLSLKDQKIALPEQRVSNLEKENDLLKQYE